MNDSKFTMIDEEFICENCKKTVKQLGYTARNHCPYCLTSKHLDINPGDRNNECKGLLKAVAIEKSKKQDFKIIFKCLKCDAHVKNIMASDDNMDMIIFLSTKSI